MASEIRFEPGLYRGAAGYYDRFRLPYPDAMIADLARRAAPSGHGRLLDLACGTGQLAFPLRGWFAEVWAVDADLTAGLGQYTAGGRLTGMVGFAYELARTPALA